MVGAGALFLTFFGMVVPAAASEARLKLDQRSSEIPLSDAAEEILRSCGSSRHAIVNVLGPSATFDIVVDCTRSAKASIAEQLVEGASRERRAAARADRIQALQASLPSTRGLTYDRSQLIWSFAIRNPETCRRAVRPSDIAQGLADGARYGGETPEHWTLIEAVMLWGACPGRLPTLLRNVDRLGHEDAASAVRSLLRSAGAAVPR
jgi:hypothetical protein